MISIAVRENTMSEHTSDRIDALLHEDRTFPPAEAFRAQANVSDPAVYDRAAADPEAFWSAFAEELHWTKPWDAVSEGTGPDMRWFVGGRLNVAENCLDRHLEAGLGGRTAVVWEGEPGDKLSWTYEEQNRIGDHIWWISDLASFRRDYPEWTLEHGLERVIQEIYEHNAERWEAATA